MGMGLSLGSVSDATIQRLLADPPLIWQVVAPDDSEMYDRARREADARSRPGFLARLFGARPADDPTSATPAPPLALSAGEGVFSDLGKAWHGIHFLVTGTADDGEPPLNFLVAGGTYVGHEDVGYGPARVFSAAESREIAAKLGGIDDDELRRRFAPEAMMAAKIYPEIWDRDPEDDDTLGYLMENVGTLREALATVTGNGHGLMVFLS
jgi:hypothetical protein